MTRRAAAGLLLATSLGGCGLQMAHARVPTVSMRMTGSPADASVSIDDEYVGPLAVVAARGVALPVGKHAISVECPGYFPWDRLVEAKDERVVLNVELVPIPD